MPIAITSLSDLSRWARGNGLEIVLLISGADESALREHYDTPHYRRYRERVGPLLARPSDVVVHHISATVQAIDPNPPDPGMLG